MLKIRELNYLVKRFKHGKTHWSVQGKKRHNVDKAMEHFDDFYGSVYGNRWKSIRISLLCERKYVALVNNFGDTEHAIKNLELSGAINLRSIYNSIKQNSKEPSIHPQSNSNNIDKKINEFYTKQHEKELPQNYTATDESLCEPNSENTSIIAKQIDYKKSLAESLIDDTEIDHSRLIDSSISASGLYEYVPSTKLKGMDDWIFETDHYKYYNTTTDFPIAIERETELEIPENLQLFTYEKGNVSHFTKPKRCLTGVNSHFLMDGASILPPLCLNIQSGDRVLDGCAAPGGKSLLILQTLRPELLVVNDVMESRINRIRKLFYEYLYDFNEKWQGKRCILTQNDARLLTDYGVYDKILVDVPCTNDRHSVMENENNIFKSTRIKERLRIPELQAAILTNCLQLLKPGGSLVYSTCSLSPIQNDGVIHMALSKLFTEFNITTTIKNLNHALKPFSNIFKFESAKNLKYGQLILPVLNANYGPMYFCKITRNV